MTETPEQALQQPARSAIAASVTPGTAPPLLVVRNLHKSYGTGAAAVPVLRDVNLTLQSGEMVAVVGASGVGKSTLLQILGTLDLPSAGAVEFNGTDITSLSASALADFRNRSIGFVFQFHHLLPEFTALENVMMPCLVQRMPRAAARAAATDMLGRVGLAKRLHHRPSQLSGGEQQRVALARAVVTSPRLLLADEPTGNLDRNTGAAIHELFLQLNHERGSTLLVVTHNPELAQMMPRRLRMVDGGQLVDAEVADTPFRTSVGAGVATAAPASEAHS